MTNPETVRCVYYPIGRAEESSPLLADIPSVLLDDIRRKAKQETYDFIINNLTVRAQPGCLIYSVSHLRTLFESQSPGGETI